MTSLLATRRRAEDFARLVEGSRRTSDPELAPLVDVVRRLRPAEIAPSDDFRQSLRAQLIAVAAERAESMGQAERVADDVLEEPSSHRSTARTPIRLRVGAMAASIVLASGMVGTAAAARSALPGDLLYPLKRGLERTEAAVTTNAESRGLEYLAHASTRLTELTELTARGRIYSDDTTRVELSVSTLQEFTRDSQNGGALLVDAFRREQRSAPLLRLREFVADAKPRLEATAQLLPTEANGAFTQAWSTLERLDHQALQLCPLCDPGTGGVGDADILSKGTGRAPGGGSNTTTTKRRESSSKPAPTRTDSTSTADPDDGSDTRPTATPPDGPVPPDPWPTIPPRRPQPTVKPPLPWPTIYPRPTTTTTEPTPTPTEDDSDFPFPLPTALPLPLPLPTVLRLPIPLPWFSEGTQSPLPAPSPVPATPPTPSPSGPADEEASRAPTATPGSPGPSPDAPRTNPPRWPIPTPIPSTPPRARSATSSTRRARHGDAALTLARCASSSRTGRSHVAKSTLHGIRPPPSEDVRTLRDGRAAARTTCAGWSRVPGR